MIAWIPAGVSPFKTENQPIDGKHRIAMLDFALAGHAQMKIDKREVKRGGVSYTVDTLSEYRAEFPNDELFLLMGADALAGLKGWKDPERICEMARFIVVNRGRKEAVFPVWDDQTTPAWVSSNVTFISMTGIDIASHDLRQRVSTQNSIRYEVPRSVENYILQHRLYL
jgi:nicotinate-nucleotide adenylyltransferase